MPPTHPDSHGDAASDDAASLPGTTATDEFRAITDKHRAYLGRIALRLAGDHATAEDLAQETLARAWQCFAAFERGTNARAWLSTILSRLFYDHLKHARVIQNTESELMRFQSAGREPSVCDVPDKQLWDAVYELEPELRDVVERCYVHELSYKQIADQLGLPVGTIGTRLKRARERLKKKLIAADAGLAVRR